MDMPKQSRRSALKTGLAAAAASFAAHDARAELAPPEPKKPGERKIVCAMGHDYRLETTIRPTLGHIPNARVWWARHYGPITPELLSDADLLVTYYAGDSFEWSPSGLVDTGGKERARLYTPENIAAIKSGIIERGMGWVAVHNTPWFSGDELNALLGADCMLHREIQPVILSNFNQEHPITKGMEPFVINLDEQFGLFLRDPDDPDVSILFKSQGVHDKRWTIQGLAAQRGKGRTVTFTPGHYEWTWYNDACQEILWRAANWAMNVPIGPFPRNYDNFIW